MAKKKTSKGSKKKLIKKSSSLSSKNKKKGESSKLPAAKHIVEESKREKSNSTKPTRPPAPAVSVDPSAKKEKRDHSKPSKPKLKSNKPSVKKYSIRNQKSKSKTKLSNKKKKKKKRIGKNNAVGAEKVVESLKSFEPSSPLRPTSRPSSRPSSGPASPPLSRPSSYPRLENGSHRRSAVDPKHTNPYGKKGSEPHRLAIQQHPLFVSRNSSSKNREQYITIEKLAMLHITLAQQTCPGSKEEVGNFCYDIMDHKNDRIYMAGEKSNIAGGSRPFLLTFFDSREKVVFRVERQKNPWLCLIGAKCFGSNAKILEGQTGEVIGEIRQLWSYGLQRYDLFDGKGTKTMVLHGPNERSCCSDYMGDAATFQIYAVHNVNRRGTPGAGRIQGAKAQGPLVRSLRSDSGSSNPDPNEVGALRVYSAPKSFRSDPYIFTIEFPFDLKPEVKIVLLGVGAIIDLTFFDAHKEKCVWYGNICTIIFGIFLMALVIVCFVLAGRYFWKMNMDDDELHSPQRLNMSVNLSGTGTPGP